jgi:TBC1 domain family member 5
MERESAELRALQRRLGDSVGWIVDTLLLDEADDQEQAKGIRERKREALECLSYVRDVLKGSVPTTQIEEDRLVGEEELKRRRAKSLEREGVAAMATKVEREPTNVGPALPPPVATAPPSFQPHTSTRRSQDHFTIGSSLTRVPVKPAPAPSPAVRSPSPTPTISVLAPNANAVPLAPWNHTRSTFMSPQDLNSLPRMPSRPSAAASVRPSAGRSASSFPPSQTPSGDTSARDQPPSRHQDPLGVLR